MAYNFDILVTVTCERTEGKFPSRDSILDELTSAIGDADPGSISLDECEVAVTSWEVVGEAPPKPKPVKVTPKVVDAAILAYEGIMYELAPTGTPDAAACKSAMRAALKASFRQMGYGVEK